MSVRAFRRYTYGVLGFTIGVILWGAYVRASGSGAGCGNHWPMCDGEVLPRPRTVEMMVELVHRLSSAVDGLLVIGLLFWSMRAFPKGHRARPAAVASGVFLVTEALLGAMLVKLELVVRDASWLRAVAMPLHLLNTFLLLAALGLTAAFASEENRPLRYARGTVLMLVGAFAGTLVVGMSGAIAALGDTLFPAASLGAGFAEDFATNVPVLLRLRAYHPLSAILVGGYLVLSSSVLTRSAGRRTRRLGSLLTTLVALELGLGTINLVLLAPITLQVLHLLAADLVWIVLVVFAASVGEEEAAVVRRRLRPNEPVSVRGVS